MFQYFTGTYVYHLTINCLKNCLDKLGHYRLTYFANRENLNIRTRIIDLSQDSLNRLEEKFDAIIINHYKPAPRLLKDFEDIQNKNGLLWVNGFRTIPFDNPDVKESDIMLDEEFELLKKNVLLDKKLYNINQREYVRYIWRIQS